MLWPPSHHRIHCVKPTEGYSVRPCGVVVVNNLYVLLSELFNFLLHCTKVRQMLIPYSLLVMSRNTLSYIAAPANRAARSSHSKLQVGLVFDLQTKHLLFSLLF